jgi:hypothetical protein
VVHTIHVKEGTEFGRKLAALDRQFRVFMIVAIVASVAYHWATGPLRPYPWLAAKLLIFHHDARERVRRLGAAQAPVSASTSAPASASASASSAGAMPASMLGAGAEETP